MINTQKHTQRIRQKWEDRGICSRFQDKTAEEDPSGTEISNLPDKGLKTMVIKMFTKLKRMNIGKTSVKR